MKYGCPECGCNRAKSDSGLQVEFLPDGSMQIWGGFIFKTFEYMCDNPDCGHEFDEPVEVEG
jgi:hypothetical protein